MIGIGMEAKKRLALGNHIGCLHTHQLHFSPKGRLYFRGHPIPDSVEIQLKGIPLRGRDIEIISHRKNGIEGVGLYL